MVVDETSQAQARVTDRSRGGLRVGRVTVAKVLFVVVLLAWPLVYKNLYAMSVMTTAGLFAMLTTAVCLILGQAGQLSFGHSAFYGMGAYTAGLLALKVHMPPLAALVVGAVLPGIIALVIGRPVLKLKYFYLALATIGLGQIFIVVVSQLPAITGGLNGFANIPTLTIMGFTMGSFIRQYYLVWIAALVILLFVQRALKYRFGRSLRAIATSEIASSALGIRNANWKLLAFVISAVICGLAGGLLAFVTGSISPTSFSFNAAVLPIVMMLVGGAESIWGGIIGAIIMTWVVNGFTSVQQYSGVAYSLVMILLLLFLPVGILGLRPTQTAWIRRLLRKEPTRGTAGVATEMDAAPDTGRDGRQATPPPAEAGRSIAGATGSGVLQQDLAWRKSENHVDGSLLRIDDVSVTFGGLKAVNAVSFAVEEGSITALIGPNGAGKTTLFNAISRQQRLAEGRVWLRDTDLTKVGPANAARLGLARTFQNLRIFVNMSVLENVLVGRHRHERSGFWSCGLGLSSQRAEERRSRAYAVDALALVGLQDQADKAAASLPYGQQRLVEIARALASEPCLLLLDEPTAGMNAGEREEMVQKIATIRAAGITVLIVEHDIGLVMGISDSVNVLDYGKLIASGSPEAVKQNPSVIRAYLGAERDRAKDLGATRQPDGTETSPAREEMLVLKDIVTSYGSIQALHGVSLTVPKGEVVAVLGANGAGKSTLLRTISGLLRPTNGTVCYGGEDITSLAAEKIVMRGLCQVPEGRQLFPTLSVEDNLMMGASGRRDWKNGFADDIAYVYELFPILGERRKQLAMTLSGGEQQMLAIGRALVGRPELLLLDEPSMGLAPLAVERIFEALGKLNEQGLTMLMVEQNAEMALSLAHRVAVMRTGSVVLAGYARDLRADDRLRAAYLGDGRA